MKYSNNGNLFDISNIYFFKDGVKQTITHVYSYVNSTLSLVWTSISKLAGVFSSGVWMNSESWGNDDLWKNKPE